MKDNPIGYKEIERPPLRVIEEKIEFIEKIIKFFKRTKFKIRKKIGKFLGKTIKGHISYKNLTIYGDNAMHFGVTYWTDKYGYICFRLPIPPGIVDYFRYDNSKLFWIPLYFYCSPNATPSASTFMLGKKHDYQNWALSRLRRIVLGHRWDINNEELREKNRKINNFFC